MRHFGAAVVLLLFGVMPTLAADLPTRKTGLWEFRMTTDFDHDGFTFQQCIDAETDQMMMSSAGPLPQEVCPRRDVQRSGDAITINSTCTLKNMSAKSHAVITGSFDSAYTMRVTAESEAIPGGRMNITTAGRWLGACAADLKPGDMMMGKGYAFSTAAIDWGVMPKLADDLPVHKAGLWEVRRIIEEPGRAGPTARACIDTATDRGVRSVTDPYAWSYLVCPRRDVQKSGDTITTDATCKKLPYHPERGGTMPSVNVHSVVSGSFDSAYTMTVTMQSDAGPGGPETIAARWLGLCPARWVPGVIDVDGFRTRR